MKKLFIIAAVAAGAMACSNDKAVNEASKAQGNAIGFRSVTQKNTRATEIDITNIKDFKAFGFWSGDFKFMHNVNVVRNTSGAWEYSPLRYWPSTGTPANDLVDFYAYSPAGSRGVTTVFAETATDPVITYTVPTAAGLQEDFLVAAAVDQNSTNVPVLVNFKHALSQLVFEARSGLDGAIFNIENIEITTLKYKADLDLSAATLAWSNVDAGISDFSAALATLPVIYNTDLTKFSRISGPNDGLMVLPQTLALGTGTDTTPADGIPDDIAAAHYLVVTYSAELASNNLEIVPAGTKVYMPIQAAVPGGGFLMGKKYIFQLTMSTGLTPIVFNVNAVEAWDPDTDGDGDVDDDDIVKL